MNMMSDIENTTPATVARPKGLAPVARRRTRDEVLIALVPVLVGRGLPTLVARAVAEAVYDGYVAAYGGIPANADHVAKALATAKGQAWLKALAAPYMAAFNAAKTAKPAAQAKAPAPVAAPKAAPLTEKQLAEGTHKVLTTKLQEAMELYMALGDAPDKRQMGDAALDIILRHIADAVWAEGATVFNAPFVYGSEEGRAIGARLAANPVKGFWMNFPKPEPKAKAPKTLAAPKVLPDDVQERLTARLRDAMQRHRTSGPSRETRDDRIIDATLAEIVATCREYGVGEFTTPYANGHPAAALVVGRYLALREELGKFFLHWTPLEEGGVPDEEAPRRTHGPTIPAPRERTAEEIEASRLKRLKREAAQAERRERDRAAREAALATGGDGGGNKGGNKGKKNPK